MMTFEPFTFQLEYEGEKKEITARPHPEPVKDDMPLSFEVAINGFPRGKIKYTANEWESTDITDAKFVDAVGTRIEQHYK